MNEENESKTNQSGKDVMINCAPAQYNLIDRVQLMLAFDPNAGDLYSKVKTLKYIDPDDSSFHDTVEQLNQQDFTMVGQMFNLFKI